MERRLNRLERRLSLPVLHRPDLSMLSLEELEFLDALTQRDELFWTEAERRRVESLVTRVKEACR